LSRCTLFWRVNSSTVAEFDSAHQFHNVVIPSEDSVPVIDCPTGDMLHGSRIEALFLHGFGELLDGDGLIGNRTVALHEAGSHNGIRR